MPEKCRMSVCGFDPMLVRGYVKTGARALWWYLPDEIFEELKVKSGDKVKGKLLAVYNPKGEKTASPNEPYEWVASKETGYAIVISSEAIMKYQLTEFHFIEFTIDEVVQGGKAVAVYPGQEKQRKWWPEERMKLSYSIPYVAP